MFKNSQNKEKEDFQRREKFWKLIEPVTKMEETLSEGTNYCLENHVIRVWKK